MSEPPAGQSTPSHKHRSLLERLTAFIFREPESREDLLEALQEAHSRDLLDADALSMIEGVLQVSELRARDLMVPRSQMDVIDVAEPVDAFIGHVIETAHSRFPVFEGNRDHVIGILLAKDLLRYYTEKDFDLRSMLRPAVFIPESKPLNVLLRDFHDAADNIVAEKADRFRVKALTEIGDFNESFGTSFADDEYDTIGGLVTDHFGRVPRRGDRMEIDGLRFEVLRADARQVHLLQVTRLPKTVVREFADTASPPAR